MRLRTEFFFKVTGEGSRVSVENCRAGLKGRTHFSELWVPFFS